MRLKNSLILLVFFSSTIINCQSKKDQEFFSYFDQLGLDYSKYDIVVFLDMDNCSSCIQDQLVHLIALENIIKDRQVAIIACGRPYAQSLLMAINQYKKTAKSLYQDSKGLNDKYAIALVGSEIITLKNNRISTRDSDLTTIEAFDKSLASVLGSISAKSR